MSIVRALLAVVIATAGVAACASSEVDQKPQKDVLMKSVTIPVEGMACDSCAARIRKNLARIDGVLDASVSFDDKRAVIQYDAHKLEPKRLVAAISGLGFKAGAPEAKL
jgi:copper chaperone CopZ